MRIDKLPVEFEQARPIMQQIEAAGYEAYFVGGSVRDTILGTPIHDVDIATSAYPEEIKHIFKHTVDTGIEHGTVMILDHGQGYETTTFRTESGYQDYRRPDEVTFVRSLEEDLMRRDFTINALALKENGEVIDLFDGLHDLDQRTIKAVGNAHDRFHEDALRMMRAVRFASQLNFSIDADTLTGIQDNAELLAKIAVERIRVEFEKMLMGQAVSRGLTPFIETKLFQFCPDFPIHEPDLRQMNGLGPIQLVNETEVWAFVALQFKLTSEAVKPFLKHWKTANQLITDVQQIISLAQEIIDQRIQPMTLYQTGLDRTLIAQHVAQIFGAVPAQSQLEADYNALPIKNRDELLINGGQLVQEVGIKPGPLFGVILNSIEAKVVAGELVNSHAELIKFAKRLVEEG